MTSYQYKSTMFKLPFSQISNKLLPPIENDQEYKSFYTFNEYLLHDFRLNPSFYHLFYSSYLSLAKFIKAGKSYISNRRWYNHSGNIYWFLHNSTSNATKEIYRSIHIHHMIIFLFIYKIHISSTYFQTNNEIQCKILFCMDWCSTLIFHLSLPTWTIMTRVCV